MYNAIIGAHATGKRTKHSKKETDTSRPSKRTEGAQLRDCSVGLMRCIKIAVLFHLWTPIVLQWASVTIGDSGTIFDGIVIGFDCIIESRLQVFYRTKRFIIDICQ